MNKTISVQLATASYTDPDDEGKWPQKTYYMVASDPTMQHLFEIDEVEEPAGSGIIGTHSVKQTFL